MRRYWTLLGMFWRSTFAAELQYRANFVANAALSLFWMAWAAIGVAVYFRFGTVIAGWSYGQLLVVIGLFFTLNGYRQLVLNPNLSRMTEYIRNGTLDFLLTKPINTQFMISFRYLGVYNLLDPLFGLALTATGLVAARRLPDLSDLGGFAVALSAAAALLYAITVVMMAVAVRIVDAQPLGRVAFTLVELGRFPVQMYRQPVQTVLSIIPVAVLTTVPALALLGRLGWWVPWTAAAGSVTVVALASLVLTRSLRSYTGASS